MSLTRAFEVFVLKAEVEQPRAPVFERAHFGFGVGELEQLDPGAVAGRQMRDPERAPAGPEHVVAHLADGAVVLLDLGRRHDQVEAKRLGVELDGLVEVRHGDPDVGEGDRNHGKLLCVGLENVADDPAFDPVGRPVCGGVRGHGHDRAGHFLGLHKALDQ